MESAFDERNPNGQPVLRCLKCNAFGSKQFIHMLDSEGCLEWWKCISCNEEYNQNVCLEQGTSQFKIRPCSNCQTDDPNLFVIIRCPKTGNLVLYCGRCASQSQVLIEAKGPAVVDFECECDNKLKDHFEIERDENGKTITIKCHVCNRIQNLGSEIQITCTKCNNNDQERFQLIDNKKGHTATAVCQSCNSDQTVGVNTKLLSALSSKGEGPYKTVKVLSSDDHTALQRAAFWQHTIVVRASSYLRAFENSPTSEFVVGQLVIPLPIQSVFIESIIKSILQMAFNPQIPEPDSFQEKVRVRSLHELQKGDHIVFQRKIGYCHHAIVVAIDAEEDGQTGKLELIEYTEDPEKWSISKSYFKMQTDQVAKEKKGKVNIQDHLVTINLKNVAVYCIQYINCFSAEKVLQRALSRVGEQKYHPFLNNCEHFAVWAKKGLSVSYQVKAVIKSGVTSLFQFGAASLANIGSFLLRFFKVGFRLATILSPALGAETIEAMEGLAGLSAIDLGACLVIIVIQAIITSHKIKKAYQNREAKMADIAKKSNHTEEEKNAEMEIERVKFTNIAKYEVLQGITKGILSAGGVLLGQFLIPVPGVGALVGGTLGSLVAWIIFRVVDFIKEGNEIKTNNRDQGESPRSESPQNEMSDPER